MEKTFKETIASVMQGKLLFYELLHIIQVKQLIICMFEENLWYGFLAFLCLSYQYANKRLYLFAVGLVGQIAFAIKFLPGVQNQHFWLCDGFYIEIKENLAQVQLGTLCTNSPTGTHDGGEFSGQGRRCQWARGPVNRVFENA